MKKKVIAIAVLSALLFGCNNDNDPLKEIIIEKPDSWYENYPYPETVGHETTFGWLGDRDAAIAYRDGGFFIRDGLDIRVGYKLFNNMTKMNWYNEDGYLPVMISEFIHDGSLVKIKNFANKVNVDGKAYVVAFSRVEVTNPKEHTITFEPSQSKELVSINNVSIEIGANQTVSFDFAIGLDRFGKHIPYLTAEQIKSLGSWDKNHDEMKEFWDARLAKLIHFDKLPDQKLVESFKSGYVYTQIIRDNDDLHVGEGGYDQVFDHDSIGILAALLMAGDLDDAKALLNKLQGVTVYDDAKYKYAWVFALYYQKSGDIEYLRSKFEEIKGFVHTIEADRTGPNGIMKITWDIDSDGHWTITNYSALFGLKAYEYVANMVGEPNEVQWAKDQYTSLYKAVETTLSKTIKENNLDYIPAGMLDSNNNIPRLAEPRDANWASHFMFGRWSWDGYLFGADQTSSDGSGEDGVMVSKIDDTYRYGFERLKGILPADNFGGYPHGWHSSSYNAGYGAAGLRGDDFRDQGIRSLQYMIENTQSGPYAWWEAMDTPTDNTSWEGRHPVKGGETDRGGFSSPHMWGQSVSSKVLINSLVAEMMNGDVIIGRGVPNEWLSVGEEIKLSNIPLSNNKRFAYHLVSGDNEVTVKFSGDIPTGNIHIDLPVFVGNSGLSTTVENAIVDVESGRVSLPSGTTEVTIQYEASCTSPSIESEKWFETSSRIIINLGDQISPKCDIIYYTLMVLPLIQQVKNT